MAINIADADAGLVRDLPRRSVHARDREDLHRRFEQRLDVAPSVCAQAPIRAAARLQTLSVSFRFVAHSIPS